MKLSMIVIPILSILVFAGMLMQLEFMSWKTPQERKLAAGAAAVLFAIAFGAFCGFTGFLR